MQILLENSGNELIYHYNPPLPLELEIEDDGYEQIFLLYHKDSGSYYSGDYHSSAKKVCGTGFDLTSAIISLHRHMTCTTYAYSNRQAESVLNKHLSHITVKIPEGLITAGSEEIKLVRDA
jgi:hypothetical protein